MNFYFLKIFKSLLIIALVLISIAFLTLLERKVMGLMQRRVGPNKVGKIQPFADGVKLVFKEIIVPIKTKEFEILIGPIIILILTLALWLSTPIVFSEAVLFDNKYSIFYILAISSLNMYLYIYSSWSSRSKYGYMGSLRSIAQLISYEVSLGLILLSVVFLTDSLNLIDLINSQIYIPFLFPLFPIFILFLISILAETNRTPFDLSESESELIAGYIIEYSGFAFASLYLSEYGFILLFSYLTSLLFNPSMLVLFTLIVLVFFVWIRSTLSRVRYDQLIDLGWTNVLPVSISCLILYISIMFVLI